MSATPPQGDPGRRKPLEARFFPRAAVALAAELRVGDAVLAGRIDNLSVGGAFLCVSPDARADAPMGARVELRVELPDGWLEAPARIVWLRASSGASERGIALSFEDLREEAALRIHRVVEALEPMAWEGAPSERAALPRELAARFVPVLRRMAARLAGSRPSSRTSADDLVGAGFLGLVEAHRRWPSRTLAGFEPYALVCMRGAMVDELRRADPLTRRQRRRAREMELASARLWTGLGRPPDDVEVAEYLGLGVDEYHACRRELASAQTVAWVDGADDVAAPAFDARPDEHVIERESRAAIEVALAALPERLRRVLELYYGDELTLREIGNLLGVSESRISQLVGQAVATLRSRVADDG
ncbi:MAG: sigma-70 family RNA polymerase sigma factor [Polyangiaceae bacterium]|nr:sigma-70 family RNA polymerase sigma factor [Polyangiaceae bacterium]